MPIVMSLSPRSNFTRPFHPPGAGGPSVLSHWRYNEVSGNAADFVGGNTGVATGIEYTVDSLQGDAGSSFGFAESSRVVAPHLPSYAGAARTVVLLVQPRSSPAASGNRIIAAKDRQDAGNALFHAGGFSIEQYSDAGTSKIRAYTRATAEAPASWLSAGGGGGATRTMPSFVAAGAGNAAATQATDLTPAVPGGTGNYLVLHVEVRDGTVDAGSIDNLGALQSTDNWTVLQDRVQNGASVNWVLGKFHDGSEAAPTIQWSGADAAYARIYAYANVDPDVPIDGLVTLTGSSTATSIGMPTVETSVDNCLALALSGSAQDLAGLTAATGETGGDWVQTVAAFVSTAGFDGTLYAQHAQMAAAGTITGGTLTQSTSTSVTVIGFALRGAPVVASGVNGVANLTVGTAYLIGLVFGFPTGNATRLYLRASGGSGSEIAASSVAPGWTDNDAEFWVGQWPTGISGFDGWIDEVRIYSGALTLTEFNALPAPVSIVHTTELWTDIVAAAAPYKWWRMNETSGTVAANSGSATPDATIVNPSTLEYNRPALVLSSNGGKSFGFPGLVTDPAYIQDTDPIVTTASFTIIAAVQLDLPRAQYIVATTGSPQATAGSFSCELRDAGGEQMQVDFWTSVGGVASHLTSAAGSVPVGEVFIVAYVQRSDATNGGRWVYVNGVEVASNVATKTFDAPPSVTGYVSSWAGGATPMNGLMAEVMTFNRHMLAAEVATFSRSVGVAVYLRNFSATVAEQSSGSINPASHAHPSSGYTPVVVAEGPVVNLTANAGTGMFDYTTGNVGSDTVEVQQVRVDVGEVQSPVVNLSITVTAAGAPPAGFDCTTSGPGTLVTLPTQTNNETTTSLNTGGNARYDARNQIKRLRWTGNHGGCTPEGRAQTTEQFMYRIPGTHNGGCVAGGAIYGNLTKDVDYDNTDNPGADGGIVTLYPCGHGGQIYTRPDGGSLVNFTIEGFRFHGCWDPIRLAREGSQVQTGTAIKGCWFTCIRDDVVENDSYIDGALFQDNLVGNVIGTGAANSGCFRFWSHAGGTSDHSAKRVYIRDNLVWASQMRMSKRTNLVNRYGVGPLFKIKHSLGPKLIITNNVFMCDAKTFAGGSYDGDPFLGLVQYPEVIQQSSGNIIIWRNVANQGSYSSLFPWGLPPGFTLMTGSAGDNEWNNRVNNWKAAHPNVRRFNISNIAQPYGYPNFNLIDTG